MKPSFDSADNKLSTGFDYIGNYLVDYKESGLVAQPISARKTLETRNKIKKGDVVYLKKYSTKIENFLVEQAELEISDFLLLKRSIDSIPYKIRYVDKIIFEGIDNIIKEDYPQFKNYIDDLALIASIAKKKCFHKDEYHNKFSQLEVSALADINNFFADIAEKKDVDIKSINIVYTKEKTPLKIGNPLLIKMMLYEFARKYYTAIYKADAEHWEEQISDYRVVKKKGKRKYNYSTYLKALIRLYWEFCEKEKLFDGKTTNEHKYCLLGKILSLVGHDKYDDDDDAKIGYRNEADFHYKIFANYWKP